MSHQGGALLSGISVFLRARRELASSLGEDATSLRGQQAAAQQRALPKT